MKINRKPWKSPKKMCDFVESHIEELSILLRDCLKYALWRCQLIRFSQNRDQCV
jgi:hypothetical protein